MGTGDGYKVAHGKMSGQAKELDGCGDDAGRIRQAVDPTMCYAPDALGGSDVAPAFDSFAAAWEAEVKTLEDALHELAGGVRLAKGSYQGSDHLVQTKTRSVQVPDAAPGAGSTGSGQRRSALSSY